MGLPDMPSVRLGDVLEVQSGFAFKTEYFTSDTGVPLIRIRDLPNTSTEINYRGEYREEFIVKQGEYLIGMDGNFRCFRWQGPRALLNQRVCRLRNFNGSADPEYVYYGIAKKLREIEDTTSFMTVKHISAKQVQNIELPLPPLAEQHRIVDLLSHAEGIVRLRREAQKKAAELIPALFLDMFGDPATNPKGWPTTTLEKVALVQGGLQLTKTRAALPLERPYLRVANVHRSRLDLGEIKHIRLSQAEFERARLFPGDLLVVEGHGNPNEIGRVAIWDGSIADCVHQNHLIRARVHADALHPSYTCEFLNSASGRQFLLRSGKTTSGLSTISVSNVKAATILLPPISHQREFAVRFGSVRSVQSQQTAATHKAEATFNALLAQVFSNTSI